MKSQVYIITCKTNMHAGSGSADQGVIDNLVQRDHTEKIPCIYASSLKGALREYFEDCVNADNDVVKDIFGGKGSDVGKGNVIFHDALLLSIPLRSNREAFFNATCPLLIERMINFMGTFGIKNDKLEHFLKIIKNAGEKPFIFNYSKNDLQVEWFEQFEFMKDDKMSGLLGDKFIVTSNDDFKLLVEDYNLPVIARNQLENGVSKNLFYEQIMPRETQFFFIINQYVEHNGGYNAIDGFKKQMIASINELPVQIGANASIGYGYCNITSFN